MARRWTLPPAFSSSNDLRPNGGLARPVYGSSVGRLSAMASWWHRPADAFLAAEPFQDDADLVLGGMVLARGAANITNQFFGWHPRGRGRGFLAHLHSPWGYDEPEILRASNRQYGPIGADARQPNSIFLPAIQSRFDLLSERLDNSWAGLPDITRRISQICTADGVKRNLALLR